MMRPSATRAYLVDGLTGVRKGFDGLAAVVRTGLVLGPYGGALFLFLFLFRGQRGDLVVALHWSGQSLCL